MTRNCRKKDSTDNQRKLSEQKPRLGAVQVDINCNFEKKQIKSHHAVLFEAINIAPRITDHPGSSEFKADGRFDVHVITVIICKGGDDH